VPLRFPTGSIEQRSHAHHGTQGRRIDDDRERHVIKRKKHGICARQDEKRRDLRAAFPKIGKKKTHLYSLFQPLFGPLSFTAGISVPERKPFFPSVMKNCFERLKRLFHGSCGSTISNTLPLPGSLST